MGTSILVALISFVAGVTVSVVAGRLSQRLKVSEFRQAWINSLREDIASYLGITQRWFHAAKMEEEPGKLFAMGNEASVILYRIKMRINPNENKHKREDDEFIASLERIQTTGGLPAVGLETHWATAAAEITLLARKLLKREWDITKQFRWW
ncbi:hypothetical protein [Bradyrhizobium sp. CCBAU 51765]|uniref:hypothetical protein n=1 Tax=Bradyrhizobium sp. CCBAU 51765 TaxID=1325102 RepID=UPI001889106B|nr:hypothetical protein [Bradyrhizobium sp. CCBAU 51765]